MQTSMLGGLLFSVMDTTIVSTALVTIATDLENFQDMYWVVLAYMLSYLGEQLTIYTLSWKKKKKGPETDHIDLQVAP